MDKLLFDGAAFVGANQEVLNSQRSRLKLFSLDTKTEIVVVFNIISFGRKHSW